MALVLLAMNSVAKGKNNQILRSIRYLLDLPDATVMQWINGQGLSATADDVGGWLHREGEEGYTHCPDTALSAFLNGLIEQRRGRREPPLPLEESVDNNAVLRKLRIAFTLRDTDIVAILAGSGKQYSKAQINALFQKPTHKNFQRCGDQVLRHFLTGLTRRYRPDSQSGDSVKSDKPNDAAVDTLPNVAAEGSPWSALKPKRSKRKDR